MASESESKVEESTVLSDKDNEIKQETVLSDKENEVNQENLNSNNSVVNEEIKFKIIKQVEYYFGNFNLPRDKFLSEQVKLEDGWVKLDTMSKFKRLAELSTDHDVIRKALKKSELMEVDDKNDRIRRSPNNPLPYFGEDLKAETVKRTIYCKGFPKDGSVNLDILLEHFKPYGPYENIHMRQFYDKQSKNNGFKGSILIVFPTVEKAKEFVEIDDVQYKQKPLLRKWHKDYLEEKSQEWEERKARKLIKLEKLETESNEPGDDSKKNIAKLNQIEPIPMGAFIFASGFTNTTTREDIKGALLEFTDDVAFVEFNKGDTEGYVRLASAYTNEELVEKIGDKLKVNDVPITVRVVDGEEEENQVKRAEEARSKMFQGGRKRKFGGRGRGQGFNKRRRH